MCLAAGYGDIEVVQTCFDSVPESERAFRMYNQMIKAYLNNAEMTGKYDKWPDVAKYFNDMIDRGFTPKRVNTNRMLISYASRCRPKVLDEAYAILRRLPKEGLVGIDRFKSQSDTQPQEVKNVPKKKNTRTVSEPEESTTEHPEQFEAPQESIEPEQQE